MDRAMVSFNVHAHSPDVEFHPAVRHFEAHGSEVISVHVVDSFTCIFLDRERLHQLTDVLVAACEKYPLLNEGDGGREQEPQAGIPAGDELLHGSDCGVWIDEPCNCVMSRLDGGRE